jgi:hypothetical protein
MKQEGSLPFQQEPVIGPYPEPDVSNPHLPSFNIVTRKGVTIDGVRIGEWIY